jgi:hypothetical protein
MNVEDGLSTYDTWLFHTVPNRILHKILKKNCNRMNKTSYNEMAKKCINTNGRVAKIKSCRRTTRRKQEFDRERITK